jgi:hypothetical protein
MWASEGAYRSYVGVLAESEIGVAGAVGTLCEITRCKAEITDHECAVLAVAFSRFRVVKASDQKDRVVVLEVEPHLDVEPEDDEFLRSRFSLTERRDVLGATELRTHLAFQNVEQMLKWSTDLAASSAKSAAYDDLHRPVHRFAPVAAERETWSHEDCFPSSALEDDDMCPIDSPLNLCMLERAVLRSQPDGEFQPNPTGTVEYGPTRRELYSFAVTRMRDLSLAEMQQYLTIQSTAERLSAAEEDMKVSRSWLEKRLGMGVGDKQARATESTEDSVTTGAKHNNQRRNKRRSLWGLFQTILD